MSRLERHNLMFVEEPVLPEYNDALGELAAATTVPIGVGQRMYSRWDFKSVVETGVVDIAQPAVSHAGGITEVCKIGTMAEAHDVLLMPKCSFGPISFAAAMHVQLALQNAVLQEQHDEFYSEANNDFFDYVENRGFFERDGGFMTIDNNPGLGITIDEAYVRQNDNRSIEWQGPTWHHEDGSIANW
jgi:galactonate dehydratase